MNREILIRSAIADFGGVIVSQQSVNNYGRDAKGGLKKEVNWKIIFEATEDDDSDKVKTLLKKVEKAFGTADVSISRYPVDHLDH